MSKRLYFFPNTILAPPANPVAVAVSATSVDVSADTVPNATSYGLYQRTGPSTFGSVALGLPTPGYTVTGLTTGVEKEYRWTAQGNGAPYTDSLFSDSAFVTPGALTPALTSATPNPSSVGGVVTLTGTNLTGVSAVAFNGVTAVFTPVSATGITATVPSGATTGNLLVTTPGGTATLTFTVLPIETGVSGDSRLTGYPTYSFPSVVARTNALLAGGQFQAIDDFVPGQSPDPTNNIAVPGYWMGGPDVTQDVASQASRLPALVNPTTAIHYNAAGVNDVDHSRTLSQFIAASQEAYQSLYDRGRRLIIAETIPGYNTSSDPNFAAKEAVRQACNAWTRANYQSLPGVVAVADAGHDRLLGVSPLPSNMTEDTVHLSDAGRIRHATLYVAACFQRVAAGERNFVHDPDPVVASAPSPTTYTSVVVPWQDLDAGGSTPANGGFFGGFSAGAADDTLRKYNRVTVRVFRSGPARNGEVKIGNGNLGDPAAGTRIGTIISGQPAAGVISQDYVFNVPWQDHSGLKLQPIDEVLTDTDGSTTNGAGTYFYLESITYEEIVGQP